MNNNLNRRDMLRAVGQSTGALAVSGIVLGHESNAESSGASLPNQTAAQEPHARISFERSVPVRHEVDVFVVGGGPAGVAAAVAAARQGASVFLAERSNCLGGMGTAGGLPLFMPFTDGVNMLAAGIGEEVLHKLRESGGTGPDSGVTIRAEVLKRVYDALALESGVRFTFCTNLIDVQASEGRVTAAVLAAKSGLFAVTAKMYIDCSGDGDLATWAGAPFEKGDAEGNLMPGTLCSLWADVDWAEVYRGGRIRDDSRLEAAFKDQVVTVEDRHLPGMFRVGRNMGGGNIGHTFGVDNTDERSVTESLIQARKSLIEYERYYKEYLKGFEQMELVGTAAQLGIRETRRILGDYVLNLKDFKRRAVFDDEIGRYAYPVDIHASKPDKASYEKFEEEFKMLRYGKGESYGIPYRILTPRGLDNVLVAGRCVSCDRYIQGSIRVMPGCFITGQTAGVAAALAAAQGATTRGVDIKELQQKLKRTGAYLPNA